MKRISNIVLLFLILILSGCGKTFKDVRITSFDIISVSPDGSNSGHALVRLGLDNPTIGFEITEASGILSVADTSCLIISADQLMVSGKCEKTYLVPVSISIPDSANVFSLLNVLKAENRPPFSLGISARAALRGGAGVRLHRSQPLDGVMNFESYASGLSGKSFKDFSIDGFEVCSVTTDRNGQCKVLIKVTATNPYIPFELSRLEGTLKFDGAEGILISNDDLTVIRKGGGTYYFTIEGRIKEGFNPCLMLNILKGENHCDVTSDISVRIAMRGGLGKTLYWKDIKLY